MRIHKTALVVLLVGVVSAAYAEDDSPSTNVWTAQNARFGPFGLLDHRSAYYRDAFPQPLLVEDTSLEEGELELSYLHTAAADRQRNDLATAEVQKSFGVFTFELSLPYQSTSDSDDHARGIGSVELGARAPIFQYLAADGWVDSTMGLGMSFGIPTQTQVSKYTGLEPMVFEDLKLGNYFTVQTVLGCDALVGGGPQSGEADIEYGVAFALTLPRTKGALPGVAQISPMFEISDEHELNKNEAGDNSVLGSVGFRIDFQAIGDVHPSFAVGYVFPVTHDAREEVRWGIATNFILEF